MSWTWFKICVHSVATPAITPASLCVGVATNNIENTTTNTTTLLMLTPSSHLYLLSHATSPPNQRGPVDVTTRLATFEENYSPALQPSSARPDCSRRQTTRQ